MYKYSYRTCLTSTSIMSLVVHTVDVHMRRDTVSRVPEMSLCPICNSFFKCVVIHMRLVGQLLGARCLLGFHVNTSTS